MAEELILVNESGEEIGFGEKLEVHQKAQLHRAFSIFVINTANQLMLQKRASHKYHSGGLWANTCCSHQIRGEAEEETTHRRLREEMGFDCELKRLFNFIYKIELDNGLTEYEYDHVYIGRYENEPKPNPEEVEDWKWIDIEDLRRDLEKNPGDYVYWIKPAFEKFYEIFHQELLGRNPA